MAKKNKRNDGYLSIRKKLIAAIAMLLVASFMVASSSYAWFTLSTAPEVKGIQTAVGANGSLEIALNVTGDANNITSGIGDTGDYTTWGNLIDVSANSFGLQNVTLLPARLGVGTNAEGKYVIDQTGMLKTPVYGADGRIEELKSAVYGSFNTKENQFMTYDESTAKTTDDDGAVTIHQNKFGVRAIGNSTAMSTQQIDFLNAQYALALALSSAQTYTSQSLTAVGGDLANIAADKAMGAGTGPYDISNVATMLAKLDAAVAQLDEAALAYCKAQYASTYTGEDYTSARDAKFTATATLDELVSAASNATLTSFWTIRGYIASAVKTANDNYKLIAKPTEATYDDANSVLGGLVDMSTMTLNGYTMEQAKDKDNQNEIVNAVAGGKGVVVTLKPKSGATAGATQGVYVDMAHLVGNYSAGTVATVNAGGLTLNGVKATMKTDVENAPTVNLASAVTSLTAPGASENSGGVIINDLYGYVLDLGFRTNAAGSYLMLQTTATDRIYSTGGSQATQGNGSSMTFSSVSTSFTTTQVKNLMQHIRIVFTNKDGTILAVAGLDAVNANVVGTEVTAPMKVYDNTTYAFDEEGKFVPQGTGLAFATPNAKGATQLLALTQNEATDICVYVYLDGDYVENKDVANAVASMTGTMNLQFSSSAELVPMSYAPLQDVSGNLATSIPATAGAGDTIALPATVGATTATWYDSDGATYTAANGYKIPTTATVGSYVTLTAKDASGNELGTYKIQIVKAAAAETTAAETTAQTP